MIAIELGENNGVKRACFKQIYDYSSEQLISIFESHISKQALLITDKWIGCKPLKKDYNITGIKSNSSDFFGVNTIVHQLKYWLISVYSWMCEAHIEKYLDEFSFRINRSYKQTIFNKLIERLVKHKNVGLQKIKISR